jgi:hypothetical protein
MKALIRKLMDPPRWGGVARGVYEVSLRLPGAAPVEISLEEAVAMRQVGRLLQRVVDNNLPSLERLVGPEPEALLEKAWEALEPVRCAAYCDGEYRVSFPGGEVGFFITTWDSALLQRYDALLDTIYQHNKEIVDTFQ